jgi:undecaprenyl-diphosphatase
MSTFQAIIFGVIFGFTEFLPVSSQAHLSFVPYVLSWPVPGGPLVGAMALGALLALFVYFRHDWASMSSSFLQVLIYRKKPMSLDERMPFFLIITTIPAAIAWYYLRGNEYVESLLAPHWLALGLFIFALLLGLSHSFGRKTKGMFDWNIIDALAIGLAQLLMFVPTCGRSTAVLSAGLFRNYNMEAIAKFSFFSAAPLLAGSAIYNLKYLDLHAPQPMADVTWFTFSVIIIVTLLSSLLAIGGFMKHIQRKGFRGYILYRLLAAATILIVFWLRSQ